jgi:hypothetical protein
VGRPLDQQVVGHPLDQQVAGRLGEMH